MATGYLADAPLSLVTGADLTTRVGTFGRLNASNVLVQSAAGEFGFPILLGARNGEMATVLTPGSVAKMRCGAAIAAGALIKSGADGRVLTAQAVAVSGAAVTGTFVLGIAFSATANADEIVEVYYHPIGAVVTTAS